MGKPRRIIHWLLSILFLLVGLGSFGSGSTASGVIFLILSLFFLPFPPFSKTWTAGKKRVKVFSILATVLLFGIGCGVMSPSKTANSGSETATAVTAVTPSPTSDITETPVPTETATPTPTETETPTPTPTETETPTPTPTEVPAAFDVSAIPAYTSDPYIAVNNNTPFFADSDLTATSYETYGDLDSLGRCTVAIANIGQDLMPTEERGNIGAIKPTGWHTVKYAGIDGNYLYNRCHLIGYQLTAENANEKNLITGTRYMNVEGMEPFENMTADYIKETGNHVLYRVTPIFEGNNLLASGVLMEAKSVEDQGAGRQFCA
ncbi:MAG: DNA/RNA non-specific endonuclease [Lachnospiraceae bacterium]|nr:DNA/RNA non-specific endonuclease [Lachnospiraceae bacterium]